ncbi:MAG: hypothetical protein CSA72_07950 [Rhodobacterales bacterium]|nr:MAG: hypothetical protein CSA72_07950 [Rhodobacterales bacterium]
MLFPLAGLVIGAIFGAWRAGKRGGTGADKVQWAMVHGILFGLIGLFGVIALDRAMF